MYLCVRVYLFCNFSILFFLHSIVAVMFHLFCFLLHRRRLIRLLFLLLRDFFFLLNFRLWSARVPLNNFKECIPITPTPHQQLYSNTLFVFSVRRLFPLSLLNLQMKNSGRWLVSLSINKTKCGRRWFCFCCSLVFTSPLLSPPNSASKFHLMNINFNLCLVTNTRE